MISDAQIGSEEWLLARNEHITASDCAVIVGASPFQSVQSLLECKLFDRRQEPNEAMKRGTALEPEARDAYMAKTRRILTPAWKVHPERKWMAATLDGITLDGECFIEIKCGKSSFAKAKQGDIPAYYKWQMEHQMRVVGLERCDYVAYDGKNMVVIEYLSDPVMQELLWEKEEKFWQLLKAIREVENEKGSIPH